METLDRTGLLLLAAIGDLAIAALLAVVATVLLGRFMSRLAERHSRVARELIEPAAGRGQRLYAYLKARRWRELHDPRAHALAFSAYLCAWLALSLVALSGLSLIASFLI